MYKNVTQIRLPKYVILTIAPLLSVMTSCDQKGDPSYEKQSLVLAAQIATVEVNLKFTEDKLKTAEATIASLTGQIATLKENQPKEVAAAPKFDKETIQLGFMRGVDKLKAKVEKEKNQHTVESVTFEKMNIPTDKPFSSGVTIKLKSKQTGQFTNFRWQGHGSLKGEWDFEPKGQVMSGSGGSVADNNTGGNTSTNAGGNTGTNAGGNTGTNAAGNTGIKVTRKDANDTGSHRVIWPEDAPRTTGQPTKARPAPPQPQIPKVPVQPKKPAKPKQPTDPNSHKVDWDKLKK